MADYVKVCPCCGSTEITIPPAGLDLVMTVPDYCRECQHRGTFPEMAETEVATYAR